MPHLTSPADVLIIGGSYAGLSAAMALGRARRSTWILDSNQPCNRQTPHSHNFLTQDGVPPAVIRDQARAQVLAYPDCRLIHTRVVAASGQNGAFIVQLDDGTALTARKLLLAGGVRDLPLPISGFAECWGISVLHCPYCHGYEVRDQPLGVIANGDMGFDYARLIRQWTSDLTLFTNGPSTLSNDQRERLKVQNIRIIEREISAIEHQAGQLHSLLLADGSRQVLTAVFARGGTEQHDDLPLQLGCELHTDGMYRSLLRVDEFGRTTVPGVYAAGDNSTPMRSVAAAVAAGNKAGAVINKELIDEDF